MNKKAEIFTLTASLMADGYESVRLYNPPSPIFTPKKHTKMSYAAHKRNKRKMGVNRKKI